MVEDISPGGVGLVVGDVVVKKFFLLQPGPRVSRLCQVRWRFGDRLGASFVEVGGKSAHAKSQSPKQMAKAIEDMKIAELIEV